MIEGKRALSGSVTAATETAATAWVQTQFDAGGCWRLWRSGDGVDSNSAPADIYEDPVQISTSFEFAPLTSGVARGNGADIQLATISFTFGATIPDLKCPLTLSS